MSVNPPTNPTVSLGVNKLIVSWTNSTTFGAFHTVYRSRGACGVFVPVAEGIQSPYMDSNVSTGEVYSYYVVAMLGGEQSTASVQKKLQYVGGSDQYKATLTSQDARSDQKGATVVFSGGIQSGCGEYQRLQKLRGKSFLCGK
jgi:hypothetical protein